MPLDDEFSTEDDFKPDEPEVSYDHWNDVNNLKGQYGIEFPPDFIQPFVDYPNPDNVRGEPFPDLPSLIEYIHDTGAFPFVVVLFDEESGLYFFAVEYEDA